MKRIFIIVFLITFIFSVASQEQEADKLYSIYKRAEEKTEKDFIGTWEVKTNYTVVMDSIMIDNVDYKFGQGFLIDNSYLDNPNIYVKFDFMDEDLLYIYQQNERAIRGFYKVIPNSLSLSYSHFHLCITLKDKENRIYPIALIMTEKNDYYQISYKLNFGDELRNSMKIFCIGEMIKQSER